jgi:hypothetical protein
MKWECVNEGWDRISFVPKQNEGYQGRERDKSLDQSTSRSKGDFGALVRTEPRQERIRFRILD